MIETESIFVGRISRLSASIGYVRDYALAAQRLSLIRALMMHPMVGGLKAILFMGFRAGPGTGNPPGSESPIPSTPLPTFPEECRSV